MVNEATNCIKVYLCICLSVRMPMDIWSFYISKNDYSAAQFHLWFIACAAKFFRLCTILPANGQRSSLTDQAIVPLFCPAYNAAKAMIISHDHFRIVVIVLCVGLLAEIVRNGSVTAASDIYHSGHASWWRHQMETFSTLLVLWEGIPPVTGGFPSQRPVTRSFDVIFELHLIKRLSKQSRRWWFEMPLWRHCNDGCRPIW